MTHIFSTLSTSGLAAVALQFWRVFKNRRAVARLYELSDEQLKDIGLTRCDLAVARRRHLLTDLSPLLTDLASEKQLITPIPVDGNSGQRNLHQLLEANSNSTLPSLVGSSRAAA